MSCQQVSQQGPDPPTGVSLNSTPPGALQCSGLGLCSPEELSQCLRNIGCRACREVGVRAFLGLKSEYQHVLCSPCLSCSKHRAPSCHARSCQRRAMLWGSRGRSNSEFRCFSPKLAKTSASPRKTESWFLNICHLIFRANAWAVVCMELQELTKMLQGLPGGTVKSPF